MPFTSPLFIVFIAVFLPLFLLIETRSRRAALAFSALGSFVFVAINFPLFALIPAGQALVLFLYQKRPNKTLPLVLLVCVPLLVPLLTFKYYDFFAPLLGLTTHGLSLPLGISFYTFTALALTLDLYRGKFEIPRSSYLGNLNLLTYWPHLASGPILRGDNFFLRQTPGRLLDRDLVTAAILLVFGLYKKLVMADGVGGLIGQNVEMGVGSMGAFDAWATVFGYSIRIYGDFSGYSDMALGFAIIMGIYIPANFNYPYSATSLTDFWRRWHISLSTWFRDYVYIPLGGNTLGTLAGSAVLMLVFTVSGLWHGAAWNFVIWGAIHGALLVAERLYRRLARPLPAALGWSLTFLLVSLAWCFFFLDFDAALSLLQRTLTREGSSLPYNNWQVLPYLVLLFVDFLLRPYRVANGTIRYTRAGMWLAPLALTALFYFAGRPLPFIYFDF